MNITRISPTTYACVIAYFSLSLLFCFCRFRQICIIVQGYGTGIQAGYELNAASDKARMDLLMV